MDEIEEEAGKPNVQAAHDALLDTNTGEVDTLAVIAESRRRVQEVRSLRDNNHFAEKFRKIIQGYRGAA